LIVADADLAPRLADINRSALTDAVIFNGPMAPIDGLVLRDGAELLRPDGVDRADVAPWETQTVIYTSGTTGPSKGVMSSSLQGATSFDYGWAGSITTDTRLLINLPLFHVSGSGVIRIALAKGASFALVPKFSTDTFWDVVRETRSTTVVLLGVMATFVMNQPPGPNDRNHTLRSALMVPLAEDAIAFKERFGADVYTVFNMTEVSSPLMGTVNPTPIGTCGTPRPGVEVRLVDANDCEVARGGIGELIVRTDAPWAMNSGYLNDPEATAKAWRNGWFHTGDAFRQDPNGSFFFVDRMKDSIRRRGENISSFEVETEVCAHPAIREAAAVAVRSDVGEDDVMVVVALNAGHDYAPADLIRFLADRMAHFMVPRYIRVLDDLPKTPTQKVEKHLLRADGVTPDTFDREAHGLTMKGGKLVEKALA
jgi:crotonobetaine/carnitine-CoA ligase